MKIIKRGKHPKDKKYTGTCQTCKTVVEFTRDEAVQDMWDRDGQLIGVKCPVCGAMIWGH